MTVFESHACNRAIDWEVLHNLRLFTIAHAHLLLIQSYTRKAGIL